MADIQYVITPNLEMFCLCPQQKRKLRLYISNTFNPAKPDADDSDDSIASWELRVEGKLLDDVSNNSVLKMYWEPMCIMHSQTSYNQDFILS